MAHFPVPLQRDVIRMGILTLAIQAMRRYMDHVGVQSSGCMLIQNITWLVEENRALVESSGGLVWVCVADCLFNESRARFKCVC
jgi:hypothetical protein